MLNMAVSEEHIRHILLYEFHQGYSASVAATNINAVYGEGTVKARKCRRWFEKFRSGDTSLTDLAREGRPVELDHDALKTAIEENPKQSLKELSLKLSMSPTTVHRHLKQLGYVFKLGKWIPRKSAAQKQKQKEHLNNGNGSDSKKTNEKKKLIKTYDRSALKQRKITVKIEDMS